MKLELVETDRLTCRCNTEILYTHPLSQYHNLLCHVLRALLIGAVPVRQRVVVRDRVPTVRAVLVDVLCEPFWNIHPFPHPYL